jgi:ATP-dependent Clp protease, protease subunit
MMKVYWYYGILVGVLFITGVALAFTFSAEAITTVVPTSLVTEKEVPRNGNQPRIMPKPLLRITAGTNDTLFLFGEVAEDNSASISQGILALNTANSTIPILLVIDSPGGAVFAGSKVISAIEASKRPVYTVCYGLCASMAAMIHQYGHKRFMTNRSILMFHNASGGVSGEVNQMLSQLNFIERFCYKMDLFIANRAHVNYREFQHYLDSQLWIDSQDATAVGFNDRIVSLNLANVKKTSLLPFVNRIKHATERIEIKQ